MLDTIKMTVYRGVQNRMVQLAAVLLLSTLVMTDCEPDDWPRRW